MTVNGRTKEKISRIKPITGPDWRRALHENFTTVVITLAGCVTAIICVWIAFGRGVSGGDSSGGGGRFAPGPRFQTIEFEDEDGKTLLKFDRESGRAWRLSKMRVPVRARKADGSVGPELVAGWVEIAATLDAGVQDTWEKLGAPTPAP